jgi:DNA-directed RNA polymerase subunit RPC12/RpoP
MRPIATKIEIEKTELEGPYECPSCGGHVKLDSTFLEQVQEWVTCPYCQTDIEIPE